MALRQVTYEFYTQEYGGTYVEEADWAHLARRAAYRLERLKALSTVTPFGDTDECESMAICALAETYQSYDDAVSNATDVASEAIGSVHVTYGDGFKAMPNGLEQAVLDSIRPYLHVNLVVA